MTNSTQATLKTIAKKINANLKVIGVKTFETGALLLQAKDSFDKSADFLKWSETETGLKKSQTYKLMKIATTFAEDEDLQGLSATVLYTLTTVSEEVLEQVRKIIGDGEVVTNDVVEAILYPPVVVEDNEEYNEYEEGDEKDGGEEEEDEELTPLQKKINKEVTKAVTKVEKAHAKTTAKLVKVEEDKDKLIKDKRAADKALATANKAKETTQEKLEKALKEVKELKAQIKAFEKALK